MISSYLLLAVSLFAIGVLGVLVRRNVLVVLMCLELMLNGVNLAAVAFSQQLQNADGQVLVMVSFAIAAAEVTVGLVIIVLLYKNFYATATDAAQNLNG
ncbi:MAG: NADH-quinone oxidoreductase subunit NuoK [Deltaproteobacteria bacterium]|nr:NADH-quinone oxidoreductase subunit NuoK [Deltaproteobacteria bacterium]